MNINVIIKMYLANRLCIILILKNKGFVLSNILKADFEKVETPFVKEVIDTKNKVA